MPALPAGSGACGDSPAFAGVQGLQVHVCCCVQLLCGLGFQAQFVSLKHISPALVLPAFVLFLETQFHFGALVDPGFTTYLG